MFWKRVLHLLSLLLLFIFLMSSTEVDNQKIDKFVFENDSLSPLTGILYLPTNENPQKIVIFITSIWYGLEPDFNSSSDSPISSVEKYIQTLVENNYGVLLLNRGNYYQLKNNLNFSINTVVSDTKLVINQLKSNKKYSNIPIGIMGASEVGCAASLIAAENEDISFSILISTPGVSGIEEHHYNKTRLYSPLLLPAYFAISFADSIYKFNKTEFIYNTEKENTQILYDNFYQGIINVEQQVINKYEVYDSVIVNANKLFLKEWTGTNFKQLIKERKDNEISLEEYTQVIIKILFSPRYIEFAKWNPILIFPQIDHPVLMLYGEDDVNINYKAGIDSVRHIIKNYELNNFTIKTYKGLDHFLFTNSEQEKKERNTSVPDFVLVDLIDWMSKLN